MIGEVCAFLHRFVIYTLKVFIVSKKKGFRLLEILKSDRRDSNPRPQPWQGCTPPTEPLSHKRVMGIEPTYLAWKASVLPLNYTRTIFNLFWQNAQNRNRTSDTRIFSPLLYQLSYLGKPVSFLASRLTSDYYSL